MKKNLMIVVYTHDGYTYTFYDCCGVSYHNRKLSFKYLGFSGLTKANFHNIAGISKHYGVENPNVEKKEL